MEPKFVRYYESELRFIRELSAEFSRRYPKVAARLGLSELGCEDPHVERVFQGFAFAGGRVHMALDAEFPALTQPLVELLNPNVLAPTPSMAVVQFSVDAQSSGLGAGFTIPRETLLETRTTSRVGAGARCEFRTAHSVRLLPISLESVAYTSVLRSIDDVRVPTREPIRALLRLKLRCHNMSFSRLNLQSLPLFVGGGDEHAARLYEQLITSASAIVMRWGPDTTQHVALGTAPRPLKTCGFDADQALLPSISAELEPYRLLQEYFACPTRFNFIELVGIAEGMSRCTHDELDLTIGLTRFDPSLEHAVNTDSLALFATPVINLFPRDCGRFKLTSGAEAKLDPDPMRPLDVEVHSITRVATRTDARGHGVELQPAYRGLADHDDTAQPRYALRRQANSLPQRVNGARSRYLGSDVYVRLVGPHAPDQARDIHVHALCTNRDLPLSLTLGHSPPGSRDFDVKSGVPADAVRCIVAPSAPSPAPTEGEELWRFLNHMSLNYLSLRKETGGIAALRDLLDLYAQLGAPPMRRQADGLRDITSQPVVGPLPGPGPRRFVRGLEVQLECDEHAFGGQGAFVLAAVLSRLFTKHTSTNAFTRTVLTTAERGEVHAFEALPGLRRVL